MIDHGNIIYISYRLFVSIVCLFALECAQMNSVGSGSSLMQAMTQYPSLGQVPVAHPYEPSQPGKELNKYASLKAVGKTAILKSACMWV